MYDPPYMKLVSISVTTRNTKEMTDFSGNPRDQDLDETIRRQIAAILHEIRKAKNRHRVAVELSSVLQRPISVAMLNDFTRTGRSGARFPAAWIPAFCAVTGDYSLLSTIAGNKLETRQRRELGRLLTELFKIADGMGRALAAEEKRKNAGRK